jgi:hypothetical protein
MAYSDDLQRGHLFQDFVAEILLKTKGISLTCYSAKANQYNKGESIQGIEVKLDARCTETGRLAIEVAELHKDWVPSGIHRQDNTWAYVQGNGQVLYFFSKRTLRNYQLAKQPQIEEWKTIRRFFVPLEVADKLCEFKIVP